MRVIRKEVFIAAPPEKVWPHLTDPAKLAGWLMPTDFGAEPGRAYAMDCGTEGKITGVVREVVPHRKLVYTWTSGHIKIETVVTITLAPEKGGTRVTLVHSGWDALPPADQGVADMFEQGWGERLGVLCERLIAQ